jgi:uncharacterized protein YciI
MPLPHRRALTRIATVLAALALGACAAPTAVAPDIFASRETHAPSRDEMWFVFLESGKTGFTERTALEAMQRGHIANFQRLFGEKKLFAAGPLKDPTEFKRGIAIVKAPSQQSPRRRSSTRRSPPRASTAAASRRCASCS